jgi:CheY-like chemotaxis protein
MPKMEAETRTDGSHSYRDGPNARPVGPALRILVVEDDADTADSMAMLLRYWGFESLAVRTAAAGLDMVRTGFPDVVLLDLALPEMDGFEFARRLRNQVPHVNRIPFLIAVSGYGDAESCRRSREAGIDLHLIKPVDPAALQALLKRFHPVIMPAAERRLALPRRTVRPIPSLSRLSEQALFKACVRRAAQIRSASHQISSELRSAGNVEEKAKILDSWCLQASRFLDETAIAIHLLTSIQRPGVNS